MEVNNIDTRNTHLAPVARDGMERMLANPITHLTMHRVHDERGDSCQQTHHTWGQREDVGET